jgi:hypothetical protein
VVGLRPRQRRTVGLGGIDGGEDERRIGPVRLGRSRAADRAACPQPLDRPGERELGAAEPLQEVATTGDPERLKLRELGVDRGEATGDPLGEHLLAGDDPVALEQQLAERAPAPIHTTSPEAHS